MKRLLIAAALLAALPLTLAAAAPMGGEEIRARGAGGEFRGYGNIRRLEDFIWRLRPDGTVRSTSTVREGGRAGQFIEYSDAGTWRVEGNRLCVQFGSVHGFLSGCYTVDGGGGDHVRLSGPANLEGTFGH